MAIPRNHRGGGGGNRISSPGEYAVTIQDIKSGKSKKGKLMLTVTFETHDEKKIAGFYVKELGFHMKALADLKLACGLKPDSGADELVGRECGIAVEAQEPDAEGRSFMTITGYGKLSELDREQSQSQAHAAEEIPF